jgi:holo-[acyl-carrier protein] synthase
VILHDGNSESAALILSIESSEGGMILGIGVDAVDIPRMRRALEKQGDRFARRVFTPAEQEYCRSHRDPTPYFAARFAAKEALFKALGTGWARGITWLDAEVCREEHGRPRLALTGRADELSRSLGTRAIHISLSHSEETAVAFVILES